MNNTSTNIDGGGLIGEVGTAYIPLGSVILYAQWVPVLSWEEPSLETTVSG